MTHARQPIAEVAPRNWHVRMGEPVHDFPGSYDEFLEKHPDLAGQHR